MRSTIAALVVSLVLLAPAAAEAKGKIRHLATGNTSGFHEGGVVVAGDPKAWQGVWNTHTAGVTPQPALPQVDFKKEMVVGIFDGDKPTAGYTVSVVGVDTASDPRLTKVKVTSTKPAAGGAAAEMITQPFDIVAIPKSTGSVQRVDAASCSK